MAMRVDVEGEGSCELVRGEWGGPRIEAPWESGGATEVLRCFASTSAALTMPKNVGRFLEMPCKQERRWFVPKSAKLSKQWKVLIERVKIKTKPGKMPMKYENGTRING